MATNGSARTPMPTSAVAGAPEGAPAGTRARAVRAAAPAQGRQPQRLSIVRLKDKLGTRSMASGEILLEGALAYLVGDAERASSR